MENSGGDCDDDKHLFFSQVFICFVVVTLFRYFYIDLFKLSYIFIMQYNTDTKT
jgi:hypothetical protein